MRFHARFSLLAALFATCVLGIDLATAQEQVQLPKAVTKDRRLTFDPTVQGQPVTLEFVVENQGKAPLELFGASAPPFLRVDHPKSVPPGGNAKVALVLDTTTLKGPSHARASVSTDDPLSPAINFIIEGEVISHVQADPSSARYLVVQGFEEQAKIVHTLWAADGGELEIVGIESPTPFLEVSYREANAGERLEKGGPGRQWRVETVLRPDSPIGPISDHLLLRLKHPKQQVFSLQVSGFVRPVFAVTPPALDLGQVKLGNDAETAGLYVKNFAVEQRTLTRVEHDLAGIKVNIDPIEAGRTYWVVLTLEPGMPKGYFSGLLTIHTSSPIQPVLRVDVKGTIL